MQISSLELSDRLIQEGGRGIDFFNHLPPEKWSTVIYSDQENWTFHELLAHFVSAEIGRRQLIENVRSAGKGVPDEFNIDMFNQVEVHHFSNLSNKALIQKFKVERVNLAEMVASFSVADLNKVGKDPYLGFVPISEMIKLTYRHLQIHLREVRRFL